MRLPSRLLLLLLRLSFLLSCPAAAQFLPEAPDPTRLCRTAVAMVERESGLPPSLMAAIARVESGRRDPATGAVHPWPWTINAEGRGSMFPTKAAAIAAVRDLQAQGVRSIDVGCMQINLMHHPNAFRSLEEAFDPLTNARYAARFLQELQSTRNDWMVTAGNYHSQTPERAESYRGAVAAAWAAERQGGPAPPPSQAMLAALQGGAMGSAMGGTSLSAMMAAPGGGGAMLSNRADRVQTLAAPIGTHGRGLDAYRSAPITMIGRGPVILSARRF